MNCLAMLHRTLQRFSAIFMAAFLVLLAINANAENQSLTNVCNAGIGGTGITQDGIGGTGIQVDAGIGGTEQQAEGIGGTGIIGIVTGFASVCVNGLEVHYNQQTLVDVDGQPSSINALNVGHLVAIRSINKGNQLKAQHISISHILVGKLEQINAAANTLQIMGQTVIVSTNTISNADLTLNQTVKVSGLAAANNRIHALRIDSASPNTLSSVTGLFDATGSINGIRIESTSKISPNSNIVVSGHWDGRTLHANRIKENVMQQSLIGAKDLIIQGIAPVSRTRQFNLQNQFISLDTDTKISGAASDKDQVMIVRGSIDSTGKITARSIEYTNEDKVLERGGSKHRPETSSSNDSAKDRGSENNDKKEDNAALEKREVAERLENVERAESVAHIEKIERAEKVERAEKTERPEKLARPKRSERHETLEH